MDTRRTIGELPGTCGSVESRRPPGDRLKHVTLNCRSRRITIVIGILTLAQACRSYTSRMLRTGVLVRLVAVYLCTVAAHAQDATWSPTPVRR